MANASGSSDRSEIDTESMDNCISGLHISKNVSYEEGKFGKIVLSITVMKY